MLRESQAIHGLIVVNPTSADPGIPLVHVIPVDKTHISICKPTSRDDQIFLETRQFIRDCVHSARHQTATRQESGSPTLPTHATEITTHAKVAPPSSQVLDSSALPLELSRVTIGILTALSEEYAACRGIFDPDGIGTERDFIANNGRLTCWVCRISARYGGQHLVAIARSPDMGNNSGAIAVSLLLQCCPNMHHVILCGIAGAVPNPQKPQDHVRLGDIVVSNRDGVIHYDFGKQRDPRGPEHSADQECLMSPFPGFELRSPPRAPCPHLLAAVSRMHADEELLGSKDRREWERKVDDYLRLSRDPSKWKRPPASRDKLIDAPGGHGAETPHPKDALRRSGVPRVFHGRIGAGNIVLADPVKRDYLRDRFGIRAVEMEGSGLADAAWVASVGYLVTRGTCDYCNSTKSDDWHHYAAVIAAAYARTVVEYLHPLPSAVSKPTSPPSLPAMLECSGQPPTAGAGLAINQTFLQHPLEPGQLPHQQHGLSAPHAQPIPTDSFPDPVEVQLPRSSAQVSERNAQAIAPDITQAARVQSLIDQIQRVQFALLQAFSRCPRQ